jgi:hypothetical protein
MESEPLNLSEIYRRGFDMPTPPASTANYETGRVNKRRRLSPPGSNPSPSTRPIRDGEADLYTPPTSAPLETISLRLTIPHDKPTKENRRTLAIRRAAAERWKPKLQKPFPKCKEISNAYKLKLLRHYPKPLHYSEPNFIKPHIDISPRVTSLLRKFPKVDTSASSPPSSAAGFAPVGQPTPTQILQTEEDYTRLRQNKLITRSEQAQQLAWKSFSTTEKDRIDRGREAMLESGLVVNDLIKEDKGLRNGLPEWRKMRTGRFAKKNQIRRK